MTPAPPRPACCICDPVLCDTVPDGEHCMERSCGSCLHGCPAPDGECCNTDPDQLDALKGVFIQ